MSIRQLIVLAAALVLTAACARTEAPTPPAAPAAPTAQQRAADGASYEQELEQWKAKRLASLKSEDGWLSLIGLFWFKEGENRFGSDPAGEVVLPEGKAPALAGTLRLAGGKVTLEARPGSGIKSGGREVGTLELRSDEDGAPTMLELGSLSFHVVKRGERLGLRVKDRENPARAEFKGTEYYPADRKWVVSARFEPYEPPLKVPILNVLGMETEEVAPGALAFEAGGREYRLRALREQGNEQLFIIFADQTSGKETYGAGRYLYADPPDADGRVTLDFNRAYSPPCAFTRYATCPLPPSENRLALRVEAGEKYLGH
ncbi:MAG: DUF1684 domain-containing protein [Acidobacteria bacterium]|nr:DUF1684 domain-containing protein [Acidobacteriota bacterium]